MSNDRHYVGGANIAGIVKASPYSSPAQEYVRIRGEAPAPTADELRFFAQRKRREPYILESLEIDHGIVLPVRNQRYTDPEHDFLKAEIDAESAEWNAELKTVHPRARDAQTWTRMDEVSIPEHVIAQVQWGLMLRPKALAFAAGEVGYETFPYPVKPDSELQEMLRARAVEFWFEHILKGIPPEPESEADVAALYPRSRACILTADADVQQDAIRLLQARKLRDAAGQLADDLAERLKLHLRDVDTLLDAAGQPLLTFKSNRDAVRTDWQALARAATTPEQLAVLVTQFTTTTPGARPLKFAAGKQASQIIAAALTQLPPLPALTGTTP